MYVTVTERAQDEAITKQQAYGQALYERTCVIVDGNDNSAQITADLLVQKIIADESIYELLTLGEQEGYTAVNFLGLHKKQHKIMKIKKLRKFGSKCKMSYPKHGFLTIQ